ncbi:MAG TPA: hypothetical protein VFT74_03260 [Isosphaeraceae bacterium]|nr:hypothetical protein [Isosphaeraceae bacterium]
MLRKTCGLAVALALLGGCDNAEEPAENVNSPSEGARIENENPTTPTVDVPNTPENEAADANANMPAPAADTTAPADEQDKDAVVVPAPADDATGSTPSGDNAGEKTLEDADAAVKTGGDETPKP